MNRIYRGVTGLRHLVASGSKYRFSTDGALNCFEVFNIPVGYHVDLAALETSYKALQKEIHPDLHHSASGSSRVAADGAPDSSAVNYAYQVLRNPGERVRHLLQVTGVEADSEEIINDPDVCREAFELREVIEAITDTTDAVELGKNITDKITQEGNKLQKYLEKGAVEDMKRSAARLVYLSKALDEVKAIDEDFEHMP